MLYGYLFIDKKDKRGYCKSLITLLERHGLNKMFECVFIENMKPEQIMHLQNNNIQEIPTILVINDQTKVQQWFEGDNAFKWVDGFLINRRQATLKNAENQRKLIQSTNIKESFKEGICDYCPNDFSGISEGYAYYDKDDKIDDEKTKMQIEKLKKFGDYYSKNDKRYNQGDNLGAIPIKYNNINDYKSREGLNATHGDTSKLIENMERSRKHQDGLIQKQMEQSTLSNIINKIEKS